MKPWGFWLSVSPPGVRDRPLPDELSCVILPGPPPVAGVLPLVLAPPLPEDMETDEEPLPLLEAEEPPLPSPPLPLLRLPAELPVRCRPAYRVALEG